MEVYAAIAVFFGLVSLGIYLVFLRPVARQSGAGEITAKTFRPGGTHLQQHPGIGRGFRTPTPIAIAESYSFEIRLDDSREVIRTALDIEQANDFEVGDRVSVEYERRGVPGVWGRVNVLAIHKLN